MDHRQEVPLYGGLTPAPGCS